MTSLPAVALSLVSPVSLCLVRHLYVLNPSSGLTLRICSSPEGSTTYFPSELEIFFPLEKLVAFSRRWWQLWADLCWLVAVANLLLAQALPKNTSSKKSAHLSYLGAKNAVVENDKHASTFSHSKWIFIMMPFSENSCRLLQKRVYGFPLLTRLKIKVTASYYIKYFAWQMPKLPFDLLEKKLASCKV